MVVGVRLEFFKKKKKRKKERKKENLTCDKIFENNKHKLIKFIKYMKCMHNKARKKVN